MSKETFRVSSIPTSETSEWIMKKHYAHRMPSVSYAFGLYENRILKGICTFGITANNNLNTINGHDALELNRLCVDSDEPNITSWFVSRCLGMFDSLIIISYADTAQDHIGKIYQATNWIYTGLSTGDVEFLKEGRKYHRKALYGKHGTGSREHLIGLGYVPVHSQCKHRYFYICGNKRFKKSVLKSFPYKILPYPKGKTSRYDASYKPISQMVLI